MIIRENSEWSGFITGAVHAAAATEFHQFIMIDPQVETQFSAINSIVQTFCVTKNSNNMQYMTFQSVERFLINFSCANPATGIYNLAAN